MMPTQYLNNVPVPGQTLVSSRDQINQNFTTIDMAFQTDHVYYTSANPIQGKHNQVTFPVQAMAPTFLATEGGIYNALDSGTSPSTNQIWIHRPTGGVDIPMTEAKLTTIGWTYLPSGILMQWGQTGVPTGTTTVTFPKSFTAPALSITVVPVSVNTLIFNALSVNSANSTSTTFQILNNSTSTNNTANWLAIGY